MAKCAITKTVLCNGPGTTSDDKDVGKIQVESLPLGSPNTCGLD